jgi:CubicO group peptidase (beta-lactamase class C family)
MLKLPSKAACVVACCVLLCTNVSAHNGKVGYAYPLPAIIVDGNFSDWPKDIVKYPISTLLSETKAVNDADYNGFLQMGYRVEDHSLYLAFTITDDIFMEDTSANVKWDSQDGLELYLDARHLPTGSAVASFMYSKKLRNINRSMYDPFTKNASWDITEVAMVIDGTTRRYEWKIKLGDQLVVGKTIGLDCFVFDRDPDGSFSFASWGKGEAKYINPKSLTDLILMPAKQQLSNVSGTVGWKRQMNVPLPHTINIKNIDNKYLWIAAEVDSLGNYSVDLPPGGYSIGNPDAYFMNGKELYGTSQKEAVKFLLKPQQNAKVPKITIYAALAPDLIPEKGILHDFTKASEQQVDNFIETYRKYYDIPGISMALIKEGKVVYYKTYGVKNTITGAKVDSNTLFEAASVTKPVFALAVEKLADRGVIDLDKPLYQYLPYKDIEYDERYKLITARHVLTHRTGFPNWRSMNPDGKLNLLFTPGTKYNYSGEGFEYLKMVVQKITGKKVEQVLKEEVIEPVGLYHTFFSRNDSLRAMVAEGHLNMMPNYDELPGSPGMAWSMHTEARIFTRFMLYLLEQKGLSEQIYKTILSKHSEYSYDSTDEKPRYPTYMGMSLEIRETPYGISFGHGGNNGDFTCLFEVYKDLKMGYVIFTNSNTSFPLLSSFRDFLIEGKRRDVNALKK